MTTLLRILNDSDMAVLLGLIAVLTVVGSKMTAVDPAARQWGRRLAGVGFVVYSVCAGLTFNACDAEDWLHILLRALVAAGLLMGSSWIGLSILFFLGRCLKSVFTSPAWAMQAAATRKHESEQRRRTEDARQRQARQDADRESRERETVARKANDSRRRDDARMSCLALYDRHGTALAEHFPRERVQEYFELYMSDASPPEIVEQRATTLVALINEWVTQDKSRQKKQFQSLGEIAAHFQAKRDEVPGLPYDSDVKDTLVTNINSEEENTIRRFLSS